VTRRVHRTGGFEDVGGYARAVRGNDYIAVSGTAPTGDDGVALYPGDVRAQTAEAFARAIEAVEALGGTLADVVRTRIFLAPEADWRASVEAHHELFRDVTPANTTLFVAGFIPPGVLVEIEVDAVVSTA
jgi:enamine deaminase RidA (YjgF/YER057c/UK114 family)